MNYTESKNRIVYLITAVLFGTAVFLKQFYFKDSGSFQMADLFFAGSVLTWLAYSFRNGLCIHKDERILLLYLSCILLVNGHYFLKDGSTDYLLYTAYYVFSVLVCLTFIFLTRNEKFLNALRVILEAVLLLQLLIMLFHIDRAFSTGSMGTFNDPNQCAFFSFAAFLLIYSLSKMTGKGFPLAWFVIGAFIDIRTGSMGSFLGFCVFAYVWLFIRALKMKGWKRSIIVSGLICVVIGTLVAVYLILETNFFVGSLPRSVAGRLTSKLNKFIKENGHLNLEGYIKDRNLVAVAGFPQYLLYGAGEGNFQRFGTELEVHSSILGPLFYYGSIPFSIWAIWYFRKLYRIRPEFICVYVALFAESFVLMNCRQPLFWMILALAGHPLAKQKTVPYKEMESDGKE